MSLDFCVIDVVPAKREEVVWKNITGNVSPMWELAGIYDELYNSDGKKVSDIIEKLEEGVMYMVRNANKFKPLNPKNGWGSYEGAVKWLWDLIHEIKKYPDGIIEISK